MRKRGANAIAGYLMEVDGSLMATSELAPLLNETMVYSIVEIALRYYGRGRWCPGTFALLLGRLIQ